MKARKTSAISGHQIANAAVTAMLNRTPTELVKYRERASDPLPMLERNGKRRLSYDIRAVFCWAVRQPEVIEGIVDPDDSNHVSADQELARQRQLTADKIALQLEQMRGGLIEVDQMEFILNLITEQVVAQLETIVPQVRRRLPTLPAQATEVISDVIARASNACADLPEHFLESLPEPARKRYRTHAPRLEIVSSSSPAEAE